MLCEVANKRDERSVTFITEGFDYDLDAVWFCTSFLIKIFLIYREIRRESVPLYLIKCIINCDEGRD